MPKNTLLDDFLERERHGGAEINPEEERVLKSKIKHTLQKMDKEYPGATKAFFNFVQMDKNEFGQLPTSAKLEQLRSFFAKYRILFSYGFSIAILEYPCNPGEKKLIGVISGNIADALEEILQVFFEKVEALLDMKGYNHELKGIKFNEWDTMKKHSFG